MEHEPCSLSSNGSTVHCTSRACLRQERIKAAQAKAIILSGGPNSVHVPEAPQLPAGFLQYVKAQGIPVLGVCYGMQLLVHVRPLLPSLPCLPPQYCLGSAHLQSSEAVVVGVVRMPADGAPLQRTSHTSGDMHRVQG